MRCPPCERKIERRLVGAIGPGELERQVFVHLEPKKYNQRPKIYPCSNVPHAEDYHFLTHQIRTACPNCKAEAYLIFKYGTPTDVAPLFKCRHCKRPFAVLRPSEPLAPCPACRILTRAKHRGFQVVQEKHDCWGYTHTPAEDDPTKGVCGNRGGFDPHPTCMLCLDRRLREVELSPAVDVEAQVNPDVSERLRLVVEEMINFPQELDADEVLLDDDSDAAARSRLLEVG